MTEVKKVYNDELLKQIKHIDEKITKIWNTLEESIAEQKPNFMTLVKRLNGLFSKRYELINFN